MKPIVVAPILAVALFFSSHIATFSQDRSGVPMKAGTPAPDFAITSVDGQQIILHAYRGKVVLIDFWATWCPPCQQATPMVQSLHRQFGAKGLKVIGISVDQPNSVGNVKPFMEHFGMTYTVSTSPDAHENLSHQYNVTGIPSLYLIDKKGYVRWSGDGYDPEEKQLLPTYIKQLLAEHS